MRYSISDAMIRLRPNSKFIIINETQVIWNDYERPQPSEEEIQAKIAELEAAEPLRLLRIERNQLLQETDWTQNRDVTLANDVEWAAYRQALRDLPNTATPELDEYGNLTNVTWPEKPA